MKKFSTIIVLILSISFASTPVLARQVMDDYMGYAHGMDNAADYMRHEQGTDDTNKHTRQKHGHSAETAAEFISSGRNIDDRQSRWSQ